VSLPSGVMGTDDRKIAKSFGGLLKELRANAELTQEALADKAGLERTYISFLERGLRQPSLRVLIALCGALKIAPSEAMRMLEERLKRAAAR
jgi:transcriptional regulator with XRE-family HTH domain